jgi:hypothetical protein
MKIISYCLFGQEQWYKNGLIENVKIAQSLFEGWVVRVYASNQIEKDYLKKIESFKNVQLIIKKEKYPFEGLLWRMLPMQENHEVVIVRDVDTRLFLRDKNLVDDWITSDFKYHICRDNPGSYNVILGGLWGGKKAELNLEKDFHSWRESYVKNKDSLYLWDIGFLRKYVYPIIRKNLVVYTEHVKMECEYNVRKIPGERGNYNGSIISLGMYIPEDFDINDQDKSLEDVKTFGRSRNEQRLEYLKIDKEFNPNHYKLRTYKVLFMYKNYYINLLYLFLRIIFNPRISLIKLIYIYINNRFLSKIFNTKKIINHNLFEEYK